MSDAKEERYVPLHFIYALLAMLLVAMVASFAVLALLLRPGDSSSAKRMKKRTVEEQNVTAVHEAGHALLCKYAMPDRPLEDVLVYAEYDEADGILGLTHAGDIPETYKKAEEIQTKSEALYFLGGAAAEQAVFGTAPVQDYADKDVVGEDLRKFCGEGDGTQCGECPQGDLVGTTCMIKGRIVAQRDRYYADALKVAERYKETLAQLANLLMRQPVQGRTRKLSAAQLEAFFKEHPVSWILDETASKALQP